MKMDKFEQEVRQNRPRLALAELLPILEGIVSRIEKIEEDLTPAAKVVEEPEVKEEAKEDKPEGQEKPKPAPKAKAKKAAAKKKAAAAETSE